MAKEQSWAKYYPESAREYDESSIGHCHLADVVNAAARAYGTRPAVSTQLPSGACATLNFNDIDRLTDDFAVFLREIEGLEAGDVVAHDTECTR